MTDFGIHRKLEFSSPDEIRKTQEELLKRHVRYCAEHSPYYRRLFREKGVDAGAVTLGRLRELPLTEKAAISRFNDDFLAVPMSEIVDIVLSSGTTG
ncbi:MAG TPA: phenylacetate--CoA ligase family protein, partial [Nitrospirota bacterium]